MVDFAPTFGPVKWAHYFARTLLYARDVAYTTLFSIILNGRIP